jgi:hypothetical protein
MEARPHPIAERVVSLLLPPACREPIVGDLHERYVSAAQYLVDALRTVPFAVWGQVRRTTSPMLAAAEAVAVYIAFVVASGITSPGRFGSATIPVGAAVAALAALATVVLRDAWAGQTPRARAHFALDAVLALTCAAVVHAALRTLGARLALEPIVSLTGMVIGVPLLTGVRVLQAPLARADSTTNGGGVMSGPRPGQRREMQRDLHRWWWTIAAVGFTAGVGLLAIPSTAPIRPLVVAWLALFVGIGVYQKRLTYWPQRPDIGADRDSVSRYRTALEFRRDEQARWPARRLRWIAGVVTVAFLLSLVRLFVPSGGTPPATGALFPLAVACGAFTLFAFTRRMTNRAAAGFQQEMDALDAESSASRPKDQNQRPPV